MFYPQSVLKVSCGSDKGSDVSRLLYGILKPPQNTLTSLIYGYMIGLMWGCVSPTAESVLTFRSRPAAFFCVCPPPCGKPHHSLKALPPFKINGFLPFFLDRQTADAGCLNAAVPLIVHRARLRCIAEAARPSASNRGHSSHCLVFHHPHHGTSQKRA